MDLIHVIPNLKNGGAENMLVNLALQLCKRGYKQSIITFENSKEDFNFSKLDKQILVLNLKTEKKKSLKILKETKAPVILWMYQSILKFEFLKLRYKLNNQYLYFNKSWIIINKELIQKYEKTIKTKEYNNIYGFIEKNELKILDNSKFKKAYTTNYKESKRSLITGRKCNTYKIEELQNLLKVINNKLDQKNKKNICILIEFELRKLNIKSDKIYFLE